MTDVVTAIAGMLETRYSGQPTQRDLDVAKVACAAGAAAERERWLSFAHDHAEDDEQCCLRGAATWLGGDADGQ